MLNRVLYIYIFDVVAFIYYLSFYCFGRFSFLMQPLEVAAILNSFDHVEFLILPALWSAYVQKQDG